MRWLDVAAAFVVLAYASSAFPSDELRKDGDSLFIDENGTTERETDRSEPSIDSSMIEVPRDYATIQAALDSDECKDGTGSAGEDQGCTIRVEPGTYAESIEIGGTALQGNAARQNSIIIEGVGPGGDEDGSGAHTCSATLTGDNTVNNSVIKINRAIGVVIRNLCISMDDGATNDPKYGIWIGYEYNTTKFIEVDHVSFSNATVSGGAGIKIGNSGAVASDGVTAHTDSPFIILKQIKMFGMQTCVVVDSEQSIGMALNGLECSNPTAAIGGLTFGSDGGEIIIRDFYFNPGADDQIGIDISNNAIGSTLIEHPTFEWDKANGTLIGFNMTGGTGSGRATTILGGRFVIQAATGTRKCIDWNRAGTLNVIGATFESQDATYTCSVDINNPSATKTSWFNWLGNDVVWDSTFTPMVFTETTSGGELRVNKFETTYTKSTATPADGTNKCETGDQWLETDVPTLHVCVNGATDDWTAL